MSWSESPLQRVGGQKALSSPLSEDDREEEAGGDREEGPLTNTVASPLPRLVLVAEPEGHEAPVPPVDVPLPLPVLVLRLPVSATVGVRMRRSRSDPLRTRLPVPVPVASTTSTWRVGSEWDGRCVRDDAWAWPVLDL